MIYIAYYCNIKTFEVPELLFHREHIKQRLSRMLVYSVAGVYDTRVYVFGQQMRRAAHGMTYNDDVRPHYVQSFTRIYKCFAFLHTRCRGGNISCRRREVFAGQLKAHSGAGGILIEKSYNRFSREMARLFHRRIEQIFERFCIFQNFNNFLRRRILHPEHIFRP